MHRSHVTTALASFVAGVFVGAGLWVALVILAAGWLAWHMCGPPPPPDRFIRHH